MFFLFDREIVCDLGQWLWPLNAPAVQVILAWCQYVPILPCSKPTEARPRSEFASHNKEVEIWPGTRLKAQSILTYPSLWPGKAYFTCLSAAGYFKTPPGPTCLLPDDVELLATTSCTESGPSPPFKRCGASAGTPAQV